MTALALPGALLLLAACDSAGGSSGPGGVSEGEARALDEAAEMLEERQLPDGVLPPVAQEDSSAPQDTSESDAE